MSSTHLTAIALFLAACSSTVTPVDSGVDATAADAEVEDADVEDVVLPDSGPVIPRDPPPWNPPIPLDTEIGWRDSTEPHCSPYAGRPVGRGASIWADDRGVFVLASIYNDPWVLGGLGFPSGVSIQFNDGTGWAQWQQLPLEPGAVAADQLSGAPDGPLFAWNGGCPVQRIEGPLAATCVYEANDVLRAYVVDADSLLLVTWPAGLIVRTDGATSTTVATVDDPLRVVGLWGGAENIVIVDYDRVLVGPLSGPLVPLSDSGATGAFTALWVTSADDLWIGTMDAELLHYAGGTWSVVPTGLREGIVDLWSDGTTMYVAGARGFATYDEVGGVDILFELPAGYTANLTSIWGSAAREEVYLTMLDADFVYYACGSAMVLVYDGTTFRRF